MPTPTADFRADPLGFMASHLVIVNIGSLAPGTLNARFERDNTKTCRTKLGKRFGKHTVPVCRLVPCNATTDVVSIYWLPYKNNQVYHLQLGHQALYMFTPTMDGCSFAVGGQDPFGAPLVAHANKQTDDGQISQAGIGQQLDGVYGQGSRRGVMTKERYTKSKHFSVGSGHVRSTTFGVSDGTAWEFWAQVWEDDHKGVKVKSRLMAMNTSNPAYGNDAWNAAFTRAGSSYELLGVKPLKVRA
jgi:hypothetical protein